MNEIFLRPLVEADLPAVLAIEEASFPSPWSHASFVHEFHNPHGQLIAAEQEGRVVGYLCCWYVVDEIHILDIAVHPTHRQQGVGAQLLRYVMTEGRKRGARSANLEVRKSNRAAIALYEKFGFQSVAVRARYYSDGEDAFLMVCSWAEDTAESG